MALRPRNQQPPLLLLFVVWCIGSPFVSKPFVLGAPSAAPVLEPAPGAQEEEGPLGEDEGFRILEADLPRTGDVVTVGGQPVRYRPVGVQDDATYEVTLAYVRPSLARVHIWLEAEGEGQRHLRVRAHRKLLALEQVCFSLSRDQFGVTIFQAGAKQYSDVEVLVAAQPLWPWSLAVVQPSSLQYDIALEHSSELRLLMAKVAVAVAAVAGLTWLIVGLVNSCCLRLAGLHWLKPAARYAGLSLLRKAQGSGLSEPMT